MPGSSSGSSPFLESPVHAIPQNNQSTDRQVMSLQYKLNTLQNQFEIEKLRLQQQANLADKKYRNTVDELEKALDDTKYLYENNNRLEEELANLKEKLGDGGSVKDQEYQKLQADLSSKDYQLERMKSEYESRLSNLENKLETSEMEAQGSQTLLRKYEDEIARKTDEVKCLQKANIEKDDEVTTLRASRVVMEHHNYSTEEFQELTTTNKMLQDQLQYSKELEETNMQQALELKRLRMANESQLFWKNENEKLQNKLEQLNTLERQFQDSQLENVNLKSQIASWGLYTDEKHSPEHIIRDWTISKKECLVLTDENEKLRLDLMNVKALNDELAQERNQLLDANRNYEANILNLKKLNHEVEQQKQLSFEECKLLRAEMEELSKFSKDSQKEDAAIYGSLVDSYKNQTEDLTGELKKLNDQLLAREPVYKKRKASDQLGLNYSQRLNELQLQNLALSRELQKCQSTIGILEEKIIKLTELKEKKIRILQLRDNPLLKDQFVKRKQLELLKRENEDLLLLRQSSGRVDFETVPVAVYDTMKFELKQYEEELFKANKKFMRLKEVFNNKSLEFIDVVNSILGFRLEFQQDSKVKIISCFKPEKYLVVDLNQNTLKSNLDRDIDGWEELLQIWVDQRGQIPCFLATITLKLWNSST
ncbi:related to Spindle assembly checkpoint component MAD1 [Zygosaccharomyces bailii]|nr:related to Spindle assembly checkpoint component MAD1 [Zygosaccharomyces bailii]